MRLIKNAFQNVSDWAIDLEKPEFKDEPDHIRKARLSIAYMFAIAPWGIAFSIIYYFLLDSPFGSIALAGSVLLAAATPIVLKYTQSVAFTGNYLTAATLLVLSSLELTIGQRSYCPLTWMPLSPLVAVGLAGKRSGIAWIVISSLVISGFLVMKHYRMLGSPPFSDEVETIFFGSVMASLAAVNGAIAVVYETIKDTALAQIRRTQAQLVESQKMVALGEMSGGVAHEINSPLAIIQMLSGQLQEAVEDPAPSPKEIGTMAKKIEATTQRIAKIISGLRNFSRDAGQDPLEAVPMTSIIKDTLALCQERFQTRGVALELGNLPDAFLVCRSVQVSQALLNLLNNAFDAIVKSPSERWIRVRADIDSSYAKIYVSDSGPGIPEEVAKKIFQPFFTTKPIGAGTGLGLSISRGLIESQGGSLTLDRQDRHTTFVIALKLSQAKSRPA